MLEATLEDAYSSLSSYLHNLAAEANLIFQGDEEGTSKTFEVLDDTEIVPGLPGQVWTGSLSAI